MFFGLGCVRLRTVRLKARIGASVRHRRTEATERKWLRKWRSLKKNFSSVQPSVSRLVLPFHKIFTFALYLSIILIPTLHPHSPSPLSINTFYQHPQISSSIALQLCRRKETPESERQLPVVHNLRRTLLFLMSPRQLHTLWPPPGYYHLHHRCHHHHHHHQTPTTSSTTFANSYQRCCR